MEGLLVISLIANAWFIYHMSKTRPEVENESRYKQEIAIKKERDNEHRQLLFDYMMIKHDGDTKKVMAEQIQFYDFAREKKMFGSPKK